MYHIIIIFNLNRERYLLYIIIIIFNLNYEGNFREE